MKIAVVRNLSDMGLSFFQEYENAQPLYPENVYASRGRFLGYIDLPIEKPKKSVTKTAGTVSCFIDLAANIEMRTFQIPNGAKNIKCTYETEE